MNFAAVAADCGYARGLKCDGADGFTQALAMAQKEPGPHLIHMRIEPGSMKDLGRPTVTPAEVALRFKDFLTS